MISTGARPTRSARIRIDPPPSTTDISIHHDRSGMAGICFTRASDCPEVEQQEPIRKSGRSLRETMTDNLG
jgi:hypothetical protein